ncbi:hypothetical protein B0J18DRAFT_262071 [Chaetomium sp. MPI-SDFR-AT-0129]|nr:hypothetical protein B0J18DRAFT_262071 [Chaetomium sp. MPI-SDFR-AT-0129]
MRKSRSTHVKCDCGEKTHKCVHLRPVLDGHKESCCCNHGGRCSCSHKREPKLDTVPESDSDEPVAAHPKVSKSNSRARRRANTTNSDAVLSFDANGHHRPTYKHAKVSQKCGPYQLSRSSSMTNAASMRNRSMDDLFSASTGASTGGDSDFASASSVDMSQAQRKVKSEATSPLLDGSSAFQIHPQLPPQLDLFIPKITDFFGTQSPEYEPPLFSATAASVDWSNYEGLELAGKTADFAPSNFSQAQSYGGFDFSGSEIPTMTTTTSTSGEVSEVEDFLSNSLDDFDIFQSTPSLNGYGFPNAQVNLLGSTDLTNLDVDVDDYTYMRKDASKFLPTPATQVGDDPTLLNTNAPTFNGLNNASLEDDPAYWMNDYGMPGLTDSPTESTMPSLWDGQ